MISTQSTGCAIRHEKLLSRATDLAEYMRTASGVDFSDGRPISRKPGTRNCGKEQ